MKKDGDTVVGRINSVFEPHVVRWIIFLEHDELPVVHRLFVCPVERLPHSLRKFRPNMFADHLLRVPTEYFSRRLVHESISPFPVQRHKRVGHILHRVIQPLFGFDELFLQPLLIGQVIAHEQHAFLVVPTDRDRGRFDRSHRTVQPFQPIDHPGIGESLCRTFHTLTQPLQIFRQDKIGRRAVVHAGEGVNPEGTASGVVQVGKTSLGNDTDHHR